MALGRAASLAHVMVAWPRDDRSVLHALARKGVVAKEIKPMKVGGVTIGAVHFGAGLALSGYRPAFAAATSLVSGAVEIGQRTGTHR